jgi:diguanylate cyclase (GGDEF)-like protein
MGSIPRTVRALLAIALAMVTAQVLHAAGVLPGPDALYEDWLAAIVPGLAAVSITARTVMERDRRLALAAVGTISWTVANALWIFPLDRTDASWTLALYVPLYVLGGTYLWLKVRERAPSLLNDTGLDVLASVLAVTAIGCAAILPLTSDTHAADAVFPIFDITLIAVVAAAFTSPSWSPEREWLLYGGAFVALAAGDIVWAAVPHGDGLGAITTLWSGAMLSFGVGPWLPDWQRRSAPSPRRLAWPFVLFLACVTILLVGDAVHVPTPALVLAAASILVTTYRTISTFRAMRQLPETRRQARTDELTGLTNRRSFLDATERQLADHPWDPAAVLMLDLDRFKELNDTMGHAAGDRLLAELGPRLSSALRPGDTLARLGGDEFAVLCPGADPAGARRVARRLQDALHEPFAIGDLLIHVDASVGIATHPRDGASVEELLQRADVAMYQAKGGGTEVETYDASRDDHSRDKLALAGELRRALDRSDGLELHYQPQACLRTDRVLAVEALVRWRHPERGLLPPAVFLPVAESAGLMRRLGREVLRRAIAQAAAWQRTGTGVPVAVNLATADLVDGGLATEIAQLLDSHELDGSWLKLEITENTVMAQPERVTETLGQLRSLGCRVSLDDFGTGHASLEHLMRLPVDELKIDRSFVTGLDHDDSASLALVRSLALLGRDLGLGVVAEGVETPRAWGHLVASGCTVAQGYLLARPLPAAELEDWLAAHRAAWEEEAA